jgi:hypothetical protein
MPQKVKSKFRGKRIWFVEDLCPREMSEQEFGCRFDKKEGDCCDHGKWNPGLGLRLPDYWTEAQNA